MNILVLGGDGYLGWPTALHLSARGHRVTVVDNLVRREYDREMGVESLVPIATLQDRATRWEQVSGHFINVRIGNLTDAAFTYGVVREAKPDAVVHFGEQRSAPYSMIDREHAVYTQVNNVVGTLNLLYAIAETDPDDPPRQARDDGRVRLLRTSTSKRASSRSPTTAAPTRCPIPKQPGSFYHLSKVHDSHNIMFACRDLGAPLDRPQPGHRVRAVHRRDRSRPGAGDPLRLRRRVRHRAQPLLRAGRRPATPLTVYGSGRPDAWHAQHPRHAGLRRPRRWRTRPNAASSGSSTSSPSPSPCADMAQMVKRVCPTPGRHRRGALEPAGRARRALLPRCQHQAPRPRPRTAPPDRRGHRGDARAGGAPPGPGGRAGDRPHRAVALQRQHADDGRRAHRTRPSSRCKPATPALTSSGDVATQATPPRAPSIARPVRSSSLAAAVAIVARAPRRRSARRCRGSRRATTPTRTAPCRRRAPSWPTSPNATAAPGAAASMSRPAGDDPPDAAVGPRRAVQQTADQSAAAAARRRLDRRRVRWQANFAGRLRRSGRSAVSELRAAIDGYLGMQPAPGRRHVARRRLPRGPVGRRCSASAATTTASPPPVRCWRSPTRSTARCGHALAAGAGPRPAAAVGLGDATRRSWQLGTRGQRRSTSWPRRPRWRRRTTSSLRTVRLSPPALPTPQGVLGGRVGAQPDLADRGDRGRGQPGLGATSRTSPSASPWPTRRRRDGHPDRVRRSASPRAPR